MTLAQALVYLRPGAEWLLHGDSYDELEWLDKNQTKPTLEEVNAAMLLKDADELRLEAFAADSLRIEFVTILKNGNPTEIENFVRARLNADGVTNLASAIAFCKRVETGFVALMKALALIIDR